MIPRAGYAAVLTQKLLSLTLPPLSPHTRLRQFLLLALLLGTGLALAWLPLTWAALLLGGTIFLTLLLLKPILSLYVLIPIIPFSSLLAVSLGGFRAGLMEIVLGLGVLAWLLQGLVRRTLNPTHTTAPAQALTSAPLTGAFLLFLAGVSLSWLDALSIGASLVETAKWVEMLALYLLVVALLPARQIPWVVAVLLLTGMAQAVLGLYQFIFKVGPEGFLLFDGRFLRAYGTFAQPNPYAGYLGLILPLALSLFIWSLTTFKPTSSLPFPSSFILHPSSFILYGFSLILLLAALFASQSRAAWLGFGVAAAVTLGIQSKKAALALAALALVAAVAGLAGSFDGGLANTNFVTQRFADALAITTITDIGAIEVNDANFATIERLAHWQAAREMWRDHPWLGVGFGNYAAIYPAYAPGRWLDPLGHAHNYLLNLGAETGLAGIVVYLIFWILTFRVSWSDISYSQGFYRAVVAGGIGILVHLHIHNFFDNLYVQGMYLHIAVILALISIIYQDRRTKLTKENLQLCFQILPISINLGPKK